MNWRKVLMDVGKVWDGGEVDVFPSLRVFNVMNTVTYGVDGVGILSVLLIFFFLCAKLINYIDKSPLFYN
jgi:hypothetical protein